MTHAVSVDIVADFVCPWCWLGKRYWEQALDAQKGIKIDSVWRPYQLDPTLPSEGRPYRDYMKAKFDGEKADIWKQMRSHLEAAGPAVGIQFNFDQITHRPNTLKAHRVMRWAAGQGHGEAFAERTFQAFFEEGRDIGQTDILAALAGEAGLDAAIVSELLATDRDAKDVWDEEVFYRKLGVSGVPTFIFNGQLAVSGAQEPRVLADAIRQATTLPPPEEDGDDT